MTIDREKSKKAILDWLNGQWQGVTPGELNRQASERCSLPKQTVREIIKELVAESELAYREQHGHTIIEPSFSRPVRLSPHIIVAPPDIPVELQPGERLVRLIQGVSFGSGQHPTTRLSVRAIEYLFENRLLPAENALLDVGTGSGILGLAGLASGIQKGEGVDIDPCSVYEAAENAALNQMTERFDVHNRPLEEMNTAFDLILANLRLPTLKNIFPQVKRLAAPACGLVISGIHTDEITGLKKRYGNLFKPVWAADEKDWAALAFLKSDSPYL